MTGMVRGVFIGNKIRANSFDISVFCFGFYVMDNQVNLLETLYLFSMIKVHTSSYREP